MGGLGMGGLGGMGMMGGLGGMGMMGMNPYMMGGMGYVRTSPCPSLPDQRPPPSPALAPSPPAKCNEC